MDAFSVVNEFMIGAAGCR